jgi:aspartyl protease family protein
MVLRSDLDQSLMGMSYLSRFARVSIEQGRLILER